MFGWLFVMSLIAGWFGLSGLMIAVGAWVAMTVVVVTFPDGPGNLFPIALAIGGSLVVMACWPATFIGSELRRLAGR